MNDELMRYLDNELPPEERQALEDRLRREPALREELERLRLAADAVRIYGVRTDVAAIHQEFMTLRPGRVVRMSRTRVVMLAAACFLFLVLGAGGFYMYSLSPEKLYGEAFVDYSVSGTRGGDSLSTIGQAYADHDYAGVTAHAREAAGPRDSLLLGLAYLKRNATDSAITVFRPLITSSYRPDAEFYLSLAYLRARRYVEALALMKAIRAQPDHLYHDYITQGMILQAKMLKLK